VDGVTGEPLALRHKNIAASFAVTKGSGFAVDPFGTRSLAPGVKDKSGTWADSMVLKLTELRSFLLMNSTPTDRFLNPVGCSVKKSPKPKNLTEIVGGLSFYSPGIPSWRAANSLHGSCISFSWVWEGCCVVLEIKGSWKLGRPSTHAGVHFG